MNNKKCWEMFHSVPCLFLKRRIWCLQVLVLFRGMEAHGWDDGLSFGINLCVCRFCSFLKSCTKLFYTLWQLTFGFGGFFFNLKNESNFEFSCPKEPLLTFIVVLMLRGLQNTYCPHSYGQQHCFVYKLVLSCLYFKWFNCGFKITVDILVALVPVQWHKGDFRLLLRIRSWLRGKYLSSCSS